MALAARNALPSVCASWRVSYEMLRLLEGENKGLGVFRLWVRGEADDIVSNAHWKRGVDPSSGRWLGV